MRSTSGANRGVDASNKLNDNVVIATEIHISTQPAGNRHRHIHQTNLYKNYLLLVGSS